MLPCCFFVFSAAKVLNQKGTKTPQRSCLETSEHGEHSAWHSDHKSTEVLKSKFRSCTSSSPQTSSDSNLWKWRWKEMQKDHYLLKEGRGKKCKLHFSKVLKTASFYSKNMQKPTNVPINSFPHPLLFFRVRRKHVILQWWKWNVYLAQKLCPFAGRSKDSTGGSGFYRLTAPTFTYKQC